MDNLQQTFFKLKFSNKNFLCISYIFLSYKIMHFVQKVTPKNFVFHLKITFYFNLFEAFEYCNLLLNQF